MTLRTRFPSVKPQGIVTDPRLWATSAGHTYLVNYGDTDLSTAMGSTNAGWNGCGWTVTGTTFSSGAYGSDFLSSTDFGGGVNAGPSTSSTLFSPRVFGSYDHALQASRFLGYFPTKLTFEIQYFIGTNATDCFVGIGAPSTATADGTGSAGCIAFTAGVPTFYSDTSSDAGTGGWATTSTLKIEVGTSTTEWFIDGASQGTITTEPDVWPVSFGMRGGTTGAPTWNWMKVYYS